MDILFWNVQRLGASTPDSRSRIFEGVMAEAFNLGARLCLLCEVTGDASVGAVTISKQVVVKKRTRKATSSQLGYGGLSGTLDEPALEEVFIPNYRDMFDHPIRYRGGNDFAKQSKRRVAYADQHDGAHLYIYHANASYKAAEMTRWVAESIRHETAGEDFVLVGDFNCEPTALDLALNEDADEYNIEDGGHTHNAKYDPPTKTYDYAIAKQGRAITVRKWDIRSQVLAITGNLSDMSDHMPIIVTF